MRRRLAALVVAGGLVSACGNNSGTPTADPTQSAISPSSPTATKSPKPRKPPKTRTAPPAPVKTTPPPSAPVRVLAISIDGLNPDAITELGASGTPAIHRLIDEGASTLNARTDVEATNTLPNHTSMVTGRPVDPAQGGHGVTWNEDLTDRNISNLASVFTVVATSGGDTAVFAGKSKFSLFQRSWPGAVDETYVDANPANVAAAVRDDLVTDDKAFTFWHIASPDAIGHNEGWMSGPYLDAVSRADAEIGAVLSAVRETPGLENLVIILTADHGGTGTNHVDTSKLADYRIPFVVWGSGIKRGDLYALDPDYQDPGTGRPGYSGPQPVRNGDLANLTTDLLGLGPVPGSKFDVSQDLSVRP